MSPSARLEGALGRIQRIVTVASSRDAPLTEHEAYEQIIEQLELVGYGSLEVDPELAHIPSAPDLRRK